MKLGVTGSLLFLLGITQVSADVYMHNPRGSNNRLNGNNANRANGNRMFDSQNNGKGGYCITVPGNTPMSYYEGSELSIEWTNQHSCGDDDRSHCNIVLQYMCGEEDADPLIRIRDGRTTQRIPANEDGATATEEDGELTYGMHESLAWYDMCKTRERNKGLFIADQNVGRDARNSRQNQPTQRGLECPEEKDYYPYWHPTPWKDIAMLTNQPEKICPLIEAESQNVKNKGNCSDPEFNHRRQCEEEQETWTETGAWGLPAPQCLGAPFSRDNHLGNGMNGFANSFNWTLPTSEQESCIASDTCACVLRLRYNISTFDYEAWGQGEEANGIFIDSTKNGENSPVYQDPYVMVNGKNLSLALNTNQYGRTFQDRSHVFKIKPRPAGVPASATIHNLNVRGKRGNIVQTYPAVEYDFVPNILNVRAGDYVHFQWTGCDNNPNGNAGEGTAKTDRSNIVQVPHGNMNMPMLDSDAALQASEMTPMFDSPELRDLMAHLGLEDCPTLTELQNKDGNNDDDDVDRDETNCFKLNPKEARYFEAPLTRMNSTGIFSYMSTRNNNFTNRSQKGTLIVNGLLSEPELVAVAAGGSVVAAGAAVGGAYAYARSHPHSRLASSLPFRA